MTRNFFAGLTLATLTAFGLAATDAHAQTALASWSFNGQTLVADGGLAVNNGVTTITSSGLTNATPNAVAGVAYNTSGPSGATSDYYLRAGIGTGGTAATSNENGYIQWAVSTKGYTGTTVSFYADNSSATSGAFTTETLYYSTNGTTFLTAPSLAVTLLQSFLAAPYTFNISSIAPGIDNDANAAFRIVFSGSTAYTGTGGPNARVDNLAVTGVAAPEPSSVAAIVIGIGAVALLAARRRKVMNFSSKLNILLT